MKILTAQQMREVDRITSERYGVPSLQLMENAGLAIADYIGETSPGIAKRRVLILCGKGNNGGDGLVVARRLVERGASPRVVLCCAADAMKGDAAANLKLWQDSGGGLQFVNDAMEWEGARGELERAEVIVDALLGTGLTGPVQGLLAEVIEGVNARKQARGNALRVVAVDMPSGLSSDAQDYGGPVVRADATVTLTAPKVGQLLNPRADCVGELVVREIGTPPELLENDATLRLSWLEPREFRGLPLRRRSDANKGTYGHALVVAGSFGKSGAAALAGRAALRVGAGLATVATPVDVLPTVAASMPELMTEPLAATKVGTASFTNVREGRLAKIAAGKSVLAIGPGLSQEPETQQFIREALEETALPVVLDADGLNAFAGHTELLAARTAPLLAMTPHPGEMARLLGVKIPEVQARRLETALESAARWQAYVVLKGWHTILATPDGRAYVNTTGNPGMASGGTGDVLTGMLAGLTAEFGTERWERVLGMGIYLHGLAGDIAAAHVGEAPLVASDVIEALPEAFAQLLAETERGAG